MNINSAHRTLAFRGNAANLPKEKWRGTRVCYDSERQNELIEQKKKLGSFMPDIDVSKVYTIRNVDTEGHLTLKDDNDNHGEFFAGDFERPITIDMLDVVE